MSNWNEVLKEIQTCSANNPLDTVRRKYLKQLHEKTGRNIIAYYSGWLQKPANNKAVVNDDDKNGFMAAIHELDRTKGLDLILHTPGGSITATESLVDYLRKMFNNNIRAIIPQLAMSAGTMIACSCKEILMGKQSSIGPIDPQFNGIPAHGVIMEFARALEEIQKNPTSIPIWQTIVGKYHPTFLGECKNAIDLSKELVETWLNTGMFNGENEQNATKNIVEKLSDHSDSKTHDRHIPIDEAKAIGLKVIDLEAEQELQDLVLTVHHSYMHSFANSKAIKIIENLLGAAHISMI